MSADPTLANELSDSTELLAYARRLLAVERPRMTTAAGQVRMNELLQRIAEVFPSERPRVIAEVFPAERAAE